MPATKRRSESTSEGVAGQQRWDAADDAYIAIVIGAVLIVVSVVWALPIDPWLAALVGAPGGLIVVIAVLRFVFRKYGIVVADAEGVHLYGREHPVRWEEVERFVVAEYKGSETMRRLNERRWDMAHSSAYDVRPPSTRFLAAWIASDGSGDKLHGPKSWGGWGRREHYDPPIDGVIATDGMHDVWEMVTVLNERLEIHGRTMAADHQSDAPRRNTA